MSMSEDLLRRMQADDARLRQTETKEVPGGIPGFTSFYETGSFVPTWVGSTIAGSFTYTAAACLVEWSRIGNRVFFNGRIVISAIGVAPTGNLTLAGWPFPAVADASMAIAGGGAMLLWAINTAAGYTDVNLNILNTLSTMNVVRSGDNVAPGNVAGGELIVGDCRFEGQYRVG